MITRLLLFLAFYSPLPPAAWAQVQVQESTVRVHVTGAVIRPGVYTLPHGARGIDAIQAAGGSTPQAALSAINLASAVQDGERLDVPRMGASKPVAQRSPGRSKVSPPRASGAKAPVTSVISLNSATADELDALPGVGPGIARDIVRYREQKGRFRTLDELKEVPGIGERRYERLAPRLKL